MEVGGITEFVLFFSVLFHGSPISRTVIDRTSTRIECFTARREFIRRYIEPGTEHNFDLWCARVRREGS